MAKAILTFLQQESTRLEQAGLLRQEVPLASAPGPLITVEKRKLINLASSDYLGLAHHPGVKQAAWEAIEKWGTGVAAPRPVSGTLRLHVELEAAVARFLGTEDALVFASGYHANTGVFESLLGERDYVFVDDQAGPSLADGVRLCSARVLSFRSGDLEHLEDRLQRSRAARFRAIVTDAVSTLEGTPAKLGQLYALADKYDAIVVADESHGLGVMGPAGKGAHEHAGLLPKVDLLTGSFANALGCGAGGFAAGKREIVTWLRQKSRPYLVSSALPASNTAAALKAFEVLSTDQKMRETLRENVVFMRTGLASAGYHVIDGAHPIVCVRIGDAVSTQRLADLLYREGVYAMGFSYPVVPEGDARLRIQVSAAHPSAVLKKALAAFETAMQELGLGTKGSKQR